ncbi:hypothetical protein N3114_11845 [Aliarcobacter butzleri]|uniref:hypothetical protein n=1 Tax=Aliarcobacter butzleri TaxID=28197 RepID=UPI0021B3B9BB|nr:hypothetical protein [Aliarcobacter butzleri]UXC29330.1 hypothetical protein N3114_11845 [Aliarcobacter butzleri]
MKKKEIKIINFLYLDEEEYNKILEYRNQEYIRKVSTNQDIISQEEHKNYLGLLRKKEKYFAFLIRNNDRDYGVISLKKITDDTYYIGDYLVNEDYKFEGGGVVNRFCILYICNKLNIKYITYDIKYINTRAFRAGSIAKIINYTEDYESFNETAEVLDFLDKDILNSKPRKLFDKLYEIKECQI